MKTYETPRLILNTTLGADIITGSGDLDIGTDTDIDTEGDTPYIEW